MKHQKKTLFWLIGISYLINFFALVILMMKAFAPHSRGVAFCLYAVSWALFLYVLKILLLEKFQKHRSLLGKYAPACGIFFGLIFTLWIMLSLFPVDNFTLTQTDKTLLAEKMHSEQVYAENYIEKLHETEGLLIKQIQKNSLTNLTLEDKNKTRELWRDYLSYVTALEEIVNQYKYFYQINVVNEKVLNQRAFLLAYASFVSSYSSTLNLMKEVEKIPLTKTLLNEEALEYEIPHNSYLKVEEKLLKPENAIQAAAGFAYLQIIKNENLTQLKISATDNYKNIVWQTGKNPNIGIQTAVDYFEKHAFTAWFPVQKRVAEQVGNTKIPLRDEALIDEGKIKILEETLMPGDILLQRRNWYLSNAGLPGFWKHTALYVGNLSDLDNTFSPSDLTEGLTVSQYIQKKYPAAYKEFEWSHKRTLEAESEGVISFTLEKSMSADYGAVLRPKVSEEEKLKALLYAFAQFGKPYDFDFDFLTDNTIVCSELYYKAYPMMNYTLRMVSGRLVLSTNHIVQDFDQQYETQKDLFDLVYFIDANEKTRQSFFSDMDSFRKSWKRTETDVVKTLVIN